MFATGKRYEFERNVKGKDTTMWGKVELYVHPMITVAFGGPVTGEWKGDLPDEPITHEIINITAPNFISAKPADE